MAAAKLGDASRYEELFRDLPFGRPARPEEIGWAVAFLASVRSAYTTGSVLTVVADAGDRAHQRCWRYFSPR